MQCLSQPFQLLPNGTAQTLDSGSDAYNAQLIAALVRTRYNERELVPTFGTSDPVMVGINPTELAAQVSQYGPNVTITAVTQTQLDFETVAAKIEYS